MQLPMERMSIAPTATAGGGCGRPATVRIMPLMSTMTATSTRSATLSTAIVVPSAPLCGLSLSKKMHMKIIADNRTLMKEKELK